MYCYVLVYFTHIYNVILVLTVCGVCRIPSSWSRHILTALQNKLATQSLQSHTSSARARVQDFPWAVQTLQLWMAGVATRSTLGCGTLAVESLTWVVRLSETRRCRREDGAWSNEVCCVLEVCTSTYLYIPVCTVMYLYLTKLVQFWNSTLSHCIPCIGDV